MHKNIISCFSFPSITQNVWTGERVKDGLDCCILICRFMQNTTTEWGWRVKTSLKKCTSHFIWKVCVWEGVRDWTKTATYWPPQPLWTLPCIVLVLLGCSAGGLGAQPLWDMFLFQHLLTNWSPNSIGGPEGPFCWVVAFLTTSCLQLTDFLSSSSYIIVQSPTQSLEWHVWSSSSGNNCHAVHRSLSSGASVYDCIAGFYLVPFCQSSPPTRFLLLTAIGMCHFLPVHHYGMACLAGSKVNIQQDTHTHTHIGDDGTDFLWTAFLFVQLFGLKSPWLYDIPVAHENSSDPISSKQQLTHCMWTCCYLACHPHNLCSISTRATGSYLL